MKLTEEKRYWNFCLVLFLAEVRVKCVGNVRNVSSTRVAEFDLLSENLDSGCLTCAYSLLFHLNTFFVTLSPKCDILM